MQHYVTLFALNVTLCLLIYYCVTSIAHGVVNYFPGLWGTGTSDAIF